MKFRPCIDLHNGKVKQIIGSTLGADSEKLVVNYESPKPPSYFANLYKQDKLTGGHVIMLGSGNEKAAQEALHAYHGYLQIGGGINSDNALYWLKQGACAVIITSYVFKGGRINRENLHKIVNITGREHLVLDLSCRRVNEKYFVATDKWQNISHEEISSALLDYLAESCAEFLIHAADREGKCEGVEIPLIEKLGKWAPIPVTYAGGVRSLEDLDTIYQKGGGRLDVTVGSALDIFGGNVPYKEVVEWHKKHSAIGVGGEDMYEKNLGD
ncbi:MAG: phosphoribosylformimino-5-aminoimidazole carboxamide ribotide isomerase [bacterium]